jgi:hypothetical protein
MSYRKSMLLLGLILLVGIVGYVGAQSPVERTRTDRDSLPQPIHRVAHKSAEEPELKAGMHPLEPALEIAYKCLENIQNNVQDYSATMVKHERIDGKLADVESMYIKIRHKPFSAYTFFKSPENLKGQEAIYGEGKNDGNMVAHGVGIQKLIGRVNLKPDGPMAMRNNRYPITEIGILNLTKRLIEVAELDKKFGECEVKFYKDAKLNKRPCTIIEVVHPVQRRNFRFHKALVFIDNEMNIPVRYAAYEWPTTPGGKPPLLEEYTYLDVKLNNGFTDADFDPNNSSYSF